MSLEGLVEPSPAEIGLAEGGIEEPDPVGMSAHEADEGGVDRTVSAIVGNSVIIDPGGQVLTGPARHEEAILYADIDLTAVRAARRFFDPVGHYHRPDIFQLSVDTRPRAAVIVQDRRFQAQRRRRSGRTKAADQWRSTTMSSRWTTSRSYSGPSSRPNSRVDRPSSAGSSDAS